MNKLSLLFVSVLTQLVSQLSAQNDFGYKEGFNLVWHDEFSDSNNTASLWNDGFPWGNVICDVGYARKDGNKLFNNGWLELQSRKERYNGEVLYWDEEGNFEPYFKDFDYTAAMLYSKQAFANGYFETRFISEPGKGLFNSFWLYGDNASEIDIFELRGSTPSDAQMTLHWKEKDPLTGSSQSISHLQANPIFGDTSHVFGVLWSPDEVSWYFNDNKVQENAWTRFIRSRHIPTVPLNIIVNTSIACLNEEPDSTTKLPGHIWFDYVRVYQNNQTVRAPIITDAQTLVYSDYEPQWFDMTTLTVNDFYATFPNGFKYELLPGEHYSVLGPQYAVESGYKLPVFLQVRVNDGINWSNSYAVQINPAANVSVSGENDIPAYFTIQPNPSNGEVQLTHILQLPVTACIYSIEGRMVYQTIITQPSIALDLSGLLPGVYSIEVVNNQRNHTKKLLLLK